MTITWHSLTALAVANPVATALSACALIALLYAAARAAERLRTRAKAADLLTILAACVATAVTMNGMWRVAGNALHFAGVERGAFFALFEVAMIASAVRARENMRESAARAREAAAEYREPPRVTAGAAGIAVWAFAAASGLVSSIDAQGIPAKLVRLAAPLVAAWLWEGGLSQLRREAGAVSMWRNVAERALARLGIAAPSRHTLSEATARWRIVRLAHAAVRASYAGKLTGGYRRWRVRCLLVTANTHADLATSAERQELLASTIATLRGAETLIALAPPAPWVRQEAATQTPATAPPSAPKTRQPTRRKPATAHAKARRLLSANPQPTIGEVAAKTGLSERTISRIKAELPTPLRPRQAMAE